MTIFFSILIPFLTALVLYFFFRHKTKWWEISVPLVVSVLFIIIFKSCSVSYLTSDTEYWNDAIVEARYYEKWNEWIVQTCEDCTTNDDGDEDCTTYDCSYQDTHYAYWEIETKTGWNLNITEEEYSRLVNRFAHKPIFVDMNRDYDTKDGDMYKVEWDGSDEKLECVVRQNTYENRPQVSDGIYNYQDVTEEEKEQYGLYEYPEISRNYKQRHILGIYDKKAEHNLEVINAKFGPTRKLKAFIVVFKDKPIEAGIKQEAYWDGGNKNEFVVTIGIDSESRVTWCHPFSWSEDESPKIKIRNFVKKQKELNLYEVTSYMEEELSKFERKNFSDFDYLNVEPTNTQKIWAYIITMLINIGLSIWIIGNEFDNYEESYSNNNRYSNRNNKIYTRRKRLYSILRKFRGFR